MSSTHWSFAGARAELARLVRQAARSPQVIEVRGTPVAVVLGIDAAHKLAGVPMGGKAKPKAARKTPVKKAPARRAAAKRR
ncbi:MAG: type II toxin-antitoxin system prevent-host-death family antitoxin [Kofleriaceae bacterium]